MESPQVSDTPLALTGAQARTIGAALKRIAVLERAVGARHDGPWMENSIRPCVIVFKSGNPGGASPTDQCTFVYDVKTADGIETLLTNVAPLNPPRTAGVRMKQPGGGNLRGEMTVWGGTLQLWNAFEVPDFAPCSSPLKGGVWR